MEINKQKTHSVFNFQHTVLYYCVYRVTYSYYSIKYNYLS